MNWYDSYTGFPYKHLGEDTETGIDCFNLCALVYKNELNIDIPYKTSDFCNIVDEDWYSKTHERWMDRAASEEHGWKKVSEAKPYDVILMSLGSTHVTNHCALYLGNNKILQTMINHNSWVTNYGRYYRQYTTGIFRWKELMN